MPAYESVLDSLIRDDPEDSLRFHRLLDAAPSEAELGTAEILAIHYSVIRDHITGTPSPSDEELMEHVGQILRWRDQIVERWHRADRLDALRAMPYREYLRTPEWQDRRLVALAAARNRCEVCNAAANLDVHHRTYERRGAEDEADLTVLCRSCHAVFHEHRDLH